MKRLLAVSLLALSMSTSVLAGDIPFPGKQDPPPCTTNCTATAPTEEEAKTIPFELIEILLTLISIP